MGTPLKWTPDKRCCICGNRARYEIESKIYCPKHWQRVRKYGEDRVLYSKRDSPPKAIIKDGWAEIELAKGEITLLDIELAPELEKRFWYLSAQGYAITRMYGSLYLMHLLVMGTPPLGKVTDHINRNKLDNRKENLRFVSHKENHDNTLTKLRTNSNGVGVDRTHGTFKAYYFNEILGKRINVGTFSTRELAQQARDIAYANYLAQAAECE